MDINAWLLSFLFPFGLKVEVYGPSDKKKNVIQIQWLNGSEESNELFMGNRFGTTKCWREFFIYCFVFTEKISLLASLPKKDTLYSLNEIALHVVNLVQKKLTNVKNFVYIFFSLLILILAIIGFVLVL